MSSEISNSHVREIATLPLHAGYGYHWRVDSDCGVVKIHSSRDGCMIAMNSKQARDLAWAFYDAMIQAAASVDRASAGGKR